MPPRKRSRKKAKAVQSEAHDEEEEVPRPALTGPVNVNTTGFSVLPAELLLEIISHIPCLPIPALPKDLESTYADRAKLSQMCRSLRRAFLPVVWERIETLRRNASAKSLATELIRQLEIVTVRDPSLAAYVKVVNVELTNYSCDTVMEEFARCLALFRNLETIQIFYTSGCPNVVDTQAAFKDRQFPSLRSVVIPDYAAAILPSCPGAQSVTWTSQMQVDSTIAWCPNIRRFSGCAHYPSPGRHVEWVNWHLVDGKVLANTLFLPTVYIIKTVGEARKPADDSTCRSSEHVIPRKVYERDLVMLDVRGTSNVSKRYLAYLA
ncbi:hypothetical protein LshimejAT787_0310640 [Lyophyllum shimeji]|uniref:F-box domain-containing protein n=1 Tax=Lyophyllum shimeji TaxID=47721 RepID=A0A9P3UKW1_LYOSH|nr:hypothetical protein LshimejAT787_0310640 [Lyophyllum shimeji]